MTGKRAPDSVGKCSRGVTDAVVKDANWRANNACIDANIDRGEGAYLTPAEQVSLTIETVAPVIAEAAYRAGRQAERETVESLISACIADDPMAERVESRNKTLFDLRDALAALTDTEGRGPGSIEGRQEPPAATTDSDVKTNRVEGEN